MNYFTRITFLISHPEPEPLFVQHGEEPFGTLNFFQLYVNQRQSFGDSIEDGLWVPVGYK